MLRKCNNCGLRTVDDKIIICSRCGATLPELSVESPEQKKKTLIRQDVPITMFPKTIKKPVDPPPYQTVKGLLLYTCLCGVLVFICIIIAVIMLGIGNSGNSATVSPAYPTPQIPQTCIGDCKIGQSATDGLFNHQKFTLNSVYYLKHPYNDPDPDVGHEWHNWDWVMLDISLENLRPEKTTDFDSFRKLTGANDVDMQCWSNHGVELSDYDFYDIPPGEVRKGKMGCLVDPKATMPFTFYYYFDDWWGEKTGDGGKTAKFLIDKFTPLDYNSIKSSLKGEKPF